MINWHHLYSISAEGEDFSIDTQIRMISSVEPEISMKMLRNLSEKLRAQLPVTTYGYSIVKFAGLDDDFSECFELEASPVAGQSLQRKDKKRSKREGAKKLLPKQVDCEFKDKHGG